MNHFLRRQRHSARQHCPCHHHDLHRPFTTTASINHPLSRSRRRRGAAAFWNGRGSWQSGARFEQTASPRAASGTRPPSGRAPAPEAEPLQHNLAADHSAPPTKPRLGGLHSSIPAASTAQRSPPDRPPRPQRHRLLPLTFHRPVPNIVARRHGHGLESPKANICI